VVVVWPNVPAGHTARQTDRQIDRQTPPLVTRDTLARWGEGAHAQAQSPPLTALNEPLAQLTHAADDVWPLAPWVSVPAAHRMQLLLPAAAPISL
jgi:hypothetical protein